LSHKKLVETIEDWKTLVVDTYEQIKRDSKPEQQQQKVHKEHNPFSNEEV
jgi:hypothetical protein